jgi:orotidine-5'-phosphate decarboxylase
MLFIDKLRQSWSKNNSLLCVGLDPEITKFPKHVLNSKQPFFDFNKAIIDATADLVCAFKPQIAYYSAHRAEFELEMTIDYIRSNYPDLIVILDAKRGDIGSTSSMYAAEAFDRYKADAVTVNPYLGLDSFAPFLDRKDKGVIILCRTSNPGAVDIQDLKIDGQKLYEIVASKAASRWNYNQNVLVVVGATYPQELKEVRAIVGDMPLLVPGIGAQGGDIKAAVSSGIDQYGTGMIINSSRAVLYASSGTDFDQAARQVALKTRDEINEHRHSVMASSKA